MRTLIIIISSLLFSSLLSGQTDLQLKITNIKEIKGQIIVNIFDKAENFPLEGKEFKTITIPVEDYSLNVQKIHLPKGEYAIALLHDENSDGECNFNWIGIPTEGYGFSQNVKPIISAPSFDETKFEMIDKHSMEISLIH